jgi:tRNA modification GTPase
LRESIEIGGLKVWLSDTAGLRSGTDEVESEGIKRTHREIKSGDLLIYLFDLNAGWDIKSIDFDRHNTLFVGNKLDIYQGESVQGDLQISALQEMGLEELKNTILTKAIGEWRESGVVANQRHLQLMEKALGFLQNAVSICEKRTETELVALEVRSSASALGEIIGEGVTEEVLENIFSRFCIGK